MSNARVKLTHWCTMSSQNAYKLDYRLSGQMQTLLPEKKNYVTMLSSNKSIRLNIIKSSPNVFGYIKALISIFREVSWFLSNKYKKRYIFMS